MTDHIILKFFAIDSMLSLAPINILILDNNFLMSLLSFVYLQNGFVECENENCPSVDDCYMLEKKKGCCERCKGERRRTNMYFISRQHQHNLLSSQNLNNKILMFISVSIAMRLECIYKGKTYESGAEWTDPDDPCASFKCVAGVVTESNMQCYTPCNNPILPRPGQCCSTCLGEHKYCYIHCYIYNQ